MKHIFYTVLFLNCFISNIFSQNFKQVFPIASDTNISEIDPYLTFYWYSGWNNHYKIANPKSTYPIWLTYIETDYSNLSRVVAYNIQQDNNYNLLLSQKHIISDTTFETQKYNPIIENFLDRPVSIWQGSNSKQSDLYFSIYSDAVWNSPEKITNDTLIEHSPLFYTLDSWESSGQSAQNNLLFWISKKSIRLTSLTSEFKWNSVKTLYNSEEKINSLKFRKCPNGDSYLVFNEYSNQDTATLKFFVQLDDEKEWNGPFSLFNISNKSSQIEINIHEDYSDLSKITLTWADGNYLRDTVFYYSDSLSYVSSFDYYDFEINDSINFTSNTLISGGCVISPWPYFFLAESDEYTTKLSFTDGHSNYSYGINYETLNSVSDLTISGIDGNKYFAAWSEFDGKQSDIYLYPDYLIVGDIEDNEISSSIFLSQNYPNPFNPTTTIKYTIPYVASGFSLSKVILKVYNILGQEISILVNQQQNPGNYQTVFNASNLPSGIYYYSLSVNNHISTKKMIFLK